MLTSTNPDYSFVLKLHNCDFKLRTKTDHIRNYFLNHSLETSPQVASDFLRKKGINVTIHHVGMVKLSIRGYRVLKRKANASGKSGRKPKQNEIQILLVAKKLLNLSKKDIKIAKKYINIAKKLSLHNYKRKS